MILSSKTNSIIYIFERILSSIKRILYKYNDHRYSGDFQFLPIISERLVLYFQIFIKKGIDTILIITRVVGISSLEVRIYKTWLIAFLKFAKGFRA
jgi:predicted transcriptional regulator